MTWQLTLSFLFALFLAASLARLSPPRALSSGWRRGWTRDDVLPRTVLSEGFKGRTKFRASSTTTVARAWAEEGRLQSIFIIYLRVSSDWLLPDLCPMARANSRAIAHGYRLSSTESSPSESRISSWVFYL